ncbi:MAG: succinylglutamate desuccinylase/aspartoacylase family protein [Candidatus Adiutrix sp.]|jgi:predicted deacylase|nr:succinylglutamate desuccinylase/aspartoacylase family protein [Candidatus Adiutrix sp.]
MTAVQGPEFTTGLAQMMIKVEGTHLKMPLSVLTGREPGRTVLVTTGLHGCEFPGTLAMIELLREIDPETMRGRVIALHPVNAQAFQARVAMILPEDGVNLNRVFPGKPDGGPSERAAWRVTQFQDMADFYLDLHSGDLYEELAPYVYFPGRGDPAVVEASRQAALVLDAPYMLRSDSTTGAYHSAALRGTPSLLLERGGGGTCRRPDVDAFKKDVRNLFKHLEILPGTPEKPRSEPVELTGVMYLKSAHNALWRCEVSAGDKVAAGQKLGDILDYFGNVQETFTAERDGVVLYRLQTLATNSGDVLVAY